MTSTKRSVCLSNRHLSFMLGLLLVLVGTTDPLLAQHGSGGGRGTHSGSHGGKGLGGHPGHFGTHLGGPHSSFGLGFHAGDFAFGFGGREGREELIGGPYRGLRYDYTLYPGSYAYDTPACGYGPRSRYPIRPGIGAGGGHGDPVGSEILGRPNPSARLDLRAEPARLVLSIPPTRAEVYLDGRLIGIAAELRHREGFLIDAGEHRLETVHPTFESRTFDFSAAPGETVELE